MMGMKEKQIVYREDGSTITDSDEIIQNDMIKTLKNMEDDYNKNSKDLGLDTTFDDFLDIIINHFIFIGGQFGYSYRPK